MEHEVSTPQQDSPPTQLQPISATFQPTKPRRRSTKPQSIKAAVMLKMGMGLNKSRIAKDLGITTNTVRAILEESEIHQNMQEVRSAFVITDKLWKAADVLCEKLDKGSESAATTILKGFNVLQSNPKVEINIANIGAQTYAQRMQARAAEVTTTNSDETPAIDVKPADKS